MKQEPIPSETDETYELLKITFGIVSFTVGSKTYKFKEPLMLKVEYVGGGVCLTHKDLSLSACGSSFSECDAIIREELAMIWEDYVLADDDVLTADAIAFKNKLLAMVEGGE